VTEDARARLLARLLALLARRFERPTGVSPRRP
jgi:hypothetical protein